MTNPKPLPNVLHLPCRKCGGPREHFGQGVCWDCMGPAERERLAHGDEHLTEAQKQRRRESGHSDV